MVSACEFLQAEARAERIVYLGEDQLMTEVRDSWHAHWKSRFTSPDTQAQDADPPAPPGPAVSIWARTAHCATAAPDAIARAVEDERARLRVGQLSTVPPRGNLSMALSTRYLLLACHDRQQLLEEDVGTASVIVFGNNDSPMVKQVGRRFFLCPGSFANGGLLLLSSGRGQLDVSLFNKELSMVAKHRLVNGTAT
jgi:hypothetical protein